MFESLMGNSSPLETIYYLATGSGVVAGLFNYFRATRLENAQRRRETYQSVSSVYLSLLATSLEHTEVPLFDEHLMLRYFEIGPDHPEIVQFRKRWIIYSLVVNCFENAYLALNTGPRRTHAEQWSGWEEWIVETLQEPEYRRMWEDFGESFDRGFCRHVNGLLAAAATE